MKFTPWINTKVMRFSLIALVLTIIISPLSMGLLGTALYFTVSAPLALLFPSDINTRQADWLRLAMIGVPILWSCGFLIAACVYSFLEALDWTTLTLKTSYIVVLLLWDLLLWSLLIFLI